MIQSLSNIQNIFFIGVAGTGMSALAQYLSGTGKNISGSDRYFSKGEASDIQEKLEAEMISCFPQDGTGISEKTELIIISTAVEESNPELQKARWLNIPVITRSQLLTLISDTKRTIAVGGTSGKSTTSAMLFDILDHAGLHPSIISGAGLVRLQKQGKIGNAYVGKGDLLVIEADESDGSIVNYHPEIGLLLNVDKDHKDMDELMQIFSVFKSHSRTFVVNRSQPLAKTLSAEIKNDFSADEKIDAGYVAKDFKQTGLQIQFDIQNSKFEINAIGKHNMENALAATAVAAQLGVSLDICAEALKKYEGIYRRNQVLGKKNDIWVIDDYAHNPAKVAAAISACQPLASKVIAWFQPHGYGPTRFLRNDFVEEISKTLREEDEIWMSEIFYAGGTATKDISSNDLINDIKQKGKKAYFVENRIDLLNSLRPHLQKGAVLLLMGARDPSLESFAKELYNAL